MVVLKADMTDTAPDVEALLIELGNTATAIPYYAVYKPEQEPISFTGVFFSPDSFLDAAGRENFLKSNSEIQNAALNDVEVESESGSPPPPGKP